MRPTTRILAAAIFALGAATLPAAAADEPAHITVTGEGRATAAPDMAVLNFGVLKSASTAREAMDAANRALSDAINGFKAKGIEGRDIQTSGFSVSPQYDYSGKNGAPPKLTGYQVSNTVTIKVRDIAALGKVLDDAVTDGINSGGSLSFQNSHEDELMAEARTAAVKDALARAKALTAAAGVSTGDILAISEENVPPAPGPVMRMAMAKEADAAAPVEAGENEYHARVTVTLAIKQ